MGGSVAGGGGWKGGISGFSDAKWENCVVKATHKNGCSTAIHNCGLCRHKTNSGNPRRIQTAKNSEREASEGAPDAPQPAVGLVSENLEFWRRRSCTAPRAAAARPREGDTYQRKIKHELSLQNQKKSQSSLKSKFSQTDLIGAREANVDPNARSAGSHPGIVPQRDM